MTSRVRSSEKVGFESGLEKRQGGQVAEVWWERVPELGSRATEGPAPHGLEAGRGHNEVGGGGGSEGAGRSGNVEEVRQIWRSEVVDGFESVQKDFEFNSKLDR